MLCRLGEAHHVERLLPSQCGKTQMARRPSMLSKQTGKAIVAYIKYKYSRTVGLQYTSCYVAFIFGLLTISYIIMTVRVFIRNIAGGDSSMYYCACPSVPVASGHLQCTDTFAWSRGCPFMTGTTVYHCWRIDHTEGQNGSDSVLCKPRTIFHEFCSQTICVPFCSRCSGNSSHSRELNNTRVSHSHPGWVSRSQIVSQNLRSICDKHTIKLRLEKRVTGKDRKALYHTHAQRTRSIYDDIPTLRVPDVVECWPFTREISDNRRRKCLQIPVSLS